jgi:hypothetical protein
MRRRVRYPTLAWVLLALCGAAAAQAGETGSGQGSDLLPRADQRFASGETNETPDFQRHVVPLLGRLGCNGRACHGSFQGKGGFRLSLFGYDFEADHKALTEEQGDEGAVRVDRENAEESLIIRKPTNADIHEGGLRYEKGNWEHHLLRGWIAGGAKFDPEKITRLERLEITPAEIVFNSAGEKAQLRVVAVWADGTKEDVTPLCRFLTNNEQTAAVTAEGLVTAGDPGDTHVVVFYDNGVVPIPVIRPVSALAGAKYPEVSTPTRIDELVVQKLRKLGVVPSEVAADAEFLRRVKLDLTGTLPAPQEVEKFLADPSPDKRAKKIDQLLESPAYAAWWTTKLCDFTGNNDNELRNAVPIRGKASQDWYDWIYRRLADNTPYDKLAEGIVLARSRQEGESYLEYCETMSKIYRGDASFADRECMPYYWARNNFRTKEDRTIGFAYAFLGLRIQCAQCHKHPFDQWTKSDFEQFSGFFTRVSAQNRGTSPEAKREYEQMTEKLGLKDKRGNELLRALPDLLKKGEIIPFPETYVTAPRPAPRNRNNKPANRGRQPAAADTAKLLGGSEALNLNDYEDPRQPVMDWLRSEDNPYFAKAFVNRVWANYFNVGIVQPPDDLSLANPPSNAPLLDYLAKGFIEHGFDMKWLHREILNSDAYQRRWETNDTNRLDTRNFSHAVPRRLPAEVAYDAVVQATASDSEVAKLQTEIQGRAIALAGSNPRPGNLNNNGPNFALSVFGRSIRESNCDCDRSMEPSLLQTVFLQNDQEVLRLIDRRDGWVGQVAKQIGSKSPPADQDRDDDKAAARQKQIATLKARLKKLRQDGDEEAVERTERRLAELREQGEGSEPSSSDKPSVAAKPIDAKGLVEQAYLRTLSRYPTAEETARSQEFIASYEDPLDGVRGVLWALLNTKEFIVNH